MVIMVLEEEISDDKIGSGEEYPWRRRKKVAI